LHPKRFDHVQSLTFQQLDKIRIGGRTPENGKLFGRERQIVNTKNKKAGPYGKKRGIQKGRRRPQAAGHPNMQVGHPKNGRRPQVAGRRPQATPTCRRATPKTAVRAFWRSGSSTPNLQQRQTSLASSSSPTSQQWWWE
jgi:hypothetical protein